jgi:DNA-binding CsgD family transcriptional regulator
VSGSDKETAVPGQFADKEDADRLYEALNGMLQRTLTDRFGVPADEADVLMHEVFGAYLTVNCPMNDPQAWLVAATCQYGAAYQRDHPPPDGATPAVSVDDVAAMRKIARLPPVAILHERAHEAVRLRFQEQKSYREIAKRLGVSIIHAQAIIRKALLKLRRAPRR